MRHWILIGLIALLGVPAYALAQVPGTGVEGSAHDFRGLVEAGQPAVGLCTFCHTPHRALATRLLWNHTLSAQTYSWSDATETVGGTPLVGFDATWQGVSKNCLSCHDGTVAIGDVAWFRAESHQGAGNELSDHTHDDAADSAKITVGPGGDGDLAGNHPIAVPFPFNNAPNTYNGVTSGNSAVKSGWVADPEAAGIRLFNDDGAGKVTAGAVAGQTGIECSSCHDPHNGLEVIDDFFLRGKVDGGAADGYLCVKCHNK